MEAQPEVRPEPLLEVAPVPEARPEVRPEVNPEPQPMVQPVPQPQSQSQLQPQPQPVPQAQTQRVRQVLVPVFKVQILTSSTLLKAGDKRFKGLSGVGHYKEGGMYKYTVGNSPNYNEVNRLRREIAKKFPEAFVIAFKDGVRMDVNEAIREFKKNRK